MTFVTELNIKDLIASNDLEKYKQILSTKLNKPDSYKILDKTLRYNIPNFNDILFNAILDGNIYLNKSAIEIIAMYENYNFTKKLITSDCLTFELEHKLLTHFIYKENSEIIELLFKKGHNPNYKNGKLFRPACNSKNEKKLKLLLDYGYEINYDNQNFIEGIINLISSKNIRHLKLLNSYGVDLSFINNTEIKMTHHNKEYLDFLNDSGIDPQNIVKIFVSKSNW
ncbi:ankyrin repeat-containing protein [Moumouvirus maliensis]|nr:ankyrin repeat-containing protein [Moumouvirus maliensis]